MSEDGAEPWPLAAWLTAVEQDERYAWAIVQWKRAAAQPGAWFDAAKADAAVALWPKYFVLTEDRFAGHPFRLNTWEEICVRLLVGWKVPVDGVDHRTGQATTFHVRLYQELRLWIARKNGKSEFLAALGLYFFVLDGTYRGQGFVFARDEDQARIVLDKMKEMIGLSDPLRVVIQSYAKSLFVPKSKSSFVLLSGVAEGKHGRSPTVILGDEMHEWLNLNLKTTLRQGTGARLEPVGLYASTAGLKDRLVGFGQWEESQAILDGRIDDPTTLVIIFTTPPDLDMYEEATWRWANPSLGVAPTLPFLRREAALAKGNPRAEAHFRRYHLNQFVDSVTRWLNLKRWDECAKDKTAWKRWPEELKGRRCFLTLDISATRDITSTAKLFPPVDHGELWKMLWRFWVPEMSMANRVRDDRVPYDKFFAAGALKTTEGDYVDQQAVMLGIQEDLEQFDVETIGYDPWNARKLIGDLQHAGVEADRFIEIRQGIPSLGEGTKHFERLIYSAQLDHGGDPVARWMAGNATIRFDENMNYMPAKKRSPEKIDGIVTGVMTCCLAFQEEASVDFDQLLANASVF